ncbi:hypothetical protein PRK78_006350 [Emydomyces testavorans]|uniref:Protein kinase domain-containing protein n=1 Tax=Emydomyces testavorans TaxID=2070801 RepID=A0AAF0DNB5_9EURO|nr:hypothetical protein PRK78_006350 [Emydomyces testavorans]
MPPMEITAAIPQYPEDSDSDWGSFASNESEEIDIEAESEPSHRYNETQHSHLFYPVCIGEVLNQRYRIEHKLGHGGFSTVWMAHDLQDKTDVALKIMVSGESGEHEYHMQKVILQNVQDASHLVTYLETFLLPGGKHSHRVLVFPLRGPCLYDLDVQKKSMTTRMSAARQLLEALESLHKAGIVHRDLNERNCMWGIVPLNHLSRRAKYEALGRPLKESLSDLPLWKQGQIVKPLKVPENLRTETFYLGDFGLAMELGAPVTPQGRPPIVYCSPDRLHNKGPSFACDMWSYMCIFAELYLGFVPFFVWFNGGMVTSMVKCLGPLPEQWKGHYVDPDSSLDTWYDQDYKPDPTYTLAKRIADRHPEADPTERQHVLSIMSRGFSYLPEKRPTATELLQDPSFKAIMKKYCC